MNIDPQILKTALKKQSERRSQREAESFARKERIFKEIPRIKEIAAEMRANMAKVARAAFESTDISAIDDIHRKNNELISERAKLLTAIGYPENYLEFLPECAFCGDTGFIADKPCDCLIRECTEIQNEKLSFIIGKGKHFENFDLSLFSQISNEKGISPRENMRKITDMCVYYAKSFAKKYENLFLWGNPGLGKTFLAECIARKVSHMGYSVVFDSAMHIISCLEQEKYNNLTDENRTHLKRISSCNLLVIDDLGAEMQSSFSVPAIYQLLNERIMQRAPMVITSCLNPDDMATRYNPQVKSRICGDFTILKFFGDDIRKKRKNCI